MQRIYVTTFYRHNIEYSQSEYRISMSWTNGMKVPGNESSRERKFPDNFAPGSESSREQIGQDPIGQFAAGSELAWE